MANTVIDKFLSLPRPWEAIETLPSERLREAARKAWAQVPPYRTWAAVSLQHEWDDYDDPDMEYIRVISEAEDEEASEFRQRFMKLVGNL